MTSVRVLTLCLCVSHAWAASAKDAASQVRLRIGGQQGLQV